MAEETLDRGRSKIAENTVALALVGAIQMAFTLIQLGVLSRFLGGERFGLYVVLRGFSLLLSTVILVGFPQVLVRFLPSFQNRGRRGSAIGWYFLFSSVTAILGAAVLITAPRWTGLMPENLLHSELTGETVKWMILASIALAMKLVLYGGFSGLREMRMQMVFELSYQILITVVILAWRDRLDVTFLFVAQFGLNAFVWIIGAPVFIGMVRKSFSGAERGTRKGIVLPSPAAYWGSALMLGYAALAFTDVDRFLMSSILPVAAISVYHVASRINQLIKRFLGFPIVALQPELTRIYEEGRWDELSGRIDLFTRAIMIVTLSVVSLAAATGGEMIALISGAGYSGSYRLLLILLPTVPAAALTAPLTAAMKGLHYMRWAVVCDLVWMSVYFAGLFVIVPRVGLVGTALAQLVASAMQATVAVALARREKLFSGAGGKPMLRAVAVFGVFAVTGAAACSMWGLPAAAACILLAPCLLRMAINRLSLFSRGEAGVLVEILRGRPGSGIVRWVLSLER